jgi:PAS domain S-box-containing protein
MSTETSPENDFSRGVDADQHASALVEGIPGVVWEAYGRPDATQQRIDFVSPYVETMLGYSVAEWLKTPNFWLTIVHPDDRERAAAAAAAAFARGEPHVNRFRWISKSGRAVWVESHSSVLRDAAGEPIGMRGVTLDISAQVQAEEELRQSQRLINETPFMITRCSRDLRYVFVSRAYAQMLGREPADIHGRTIAEILGDEAFATIRPYIERVLSGSEVHYDTDLPLPNGSTRTLQVMYKPDVDPSGQTIGWIASMVDITDRKGARDARRLLASIVDSSFDAIVTKNLDGIVTSWNAAAERLFGYTASEMIGKPIRLLIPPERQAEEDDILARLRHGDRIEHFETIRVTKDGRRLNISLSISPIRNATGTIVGASKIARNVTEMRQAATERVRLLEENVAITEALNRVGTIVASDLDRDKVVQAVTDAATELTTAGFGAFFYNVTNDAGESYMLYTISGAPREAFATFPMPRNTEVFEPTFKGTGVVRSADITKDPRYGHNPPHHGMPAGHLPVRSYLAVPVSGRSGEVIGGLFFGHPDVDRFTEHHERLAIGVSAWAAVALENARMFGMVQESSRLKDEFLASLSHELRTPLNAVLGYARMLRTGMVSADKQAKAIETIERNATSLTQIVEDVLDISRIISGKIRLNVQPVDVPSIVQNAIDAVSPAADAKGVRLEPILDPQASPVSGDPERLQQVLWNLLSNAVKFTGRGGKVQIRLGRMNSHIEVTVADTGIGIPREFLPHVFERFRQADAGMARERGGLGLGLSIARQLAEMHGGTIEAASGGPGQGATFTVKLPLMIVHPTREDPGRVYPRAVAAAQPIPRGDLQDVHVLAVDDDPDALTLVAELLEAAGARVSTASSADDALRVLEAELPQVIVTDLGMPRVDGFELIERIRGHRNPLVRHVPAAALTAYARSDDRVRALRAGFQIHLAKPIDPAELVTAIAALAKRFIPGAGPGGHQAG